MPSEPLPPLYGGLKNPVKLPNVMYSAAALNCKLMAERREVHGPPEAAGLAEMPSPQLQIRFAHWPAPAQPCCERQRVLPRHAHLHGAPLATSALPTAIQRGMLRLGCSPWGACQAGACPRPQGAKSFLGASLSLGAVEISKRLAYELFHGLCGASCLL
jgi:hypothetical protein